MVAVAVRMGYFECGHSVGCLLDNIVAVGHNNPSDCLFRYYCNIAGHFDCNNSVHRNLVAHLVGPAVADLVPLYHCRQKEFYY